MSRFAHAYDTRDLIVRRLEEDLLGGPDEDALNEPPLSRFVVGILYPEMLERTGAHEGNDHSSDGVAASIEDDVENDVEAEVGDSSDSVSDPAVAMSRVRYPRSMGMTVAVAENPGAALRVTVSTHRYAQAVEGEWVREKSIEWAQDIPLGSPGLARVEVTPGLELVVHERVPSRGHVAVTITLLNTLAAPYGGKDASCWFAPKIAVTPVGTSLTERPAPGVPGTDDQELASQRVLFRDVNSFGVGHGCAVTWESNAPESVQTTFIPRHELLLSEAAGGDDLDLSMNSFVTDEDFGILERLVEMYSAWIDKLVPASSHLETDDQEAVRRHASEAREAAGRMRDGIGLLRTDPAVRRAFQLTNAAMAQQRSRQEFHRAGNLGNPTSTAGAAWRPFQMAFILTNLRGLADAEHKDRRLADLLWFPTGGGKTEAYLGLIGISILLRRLRDKTAGGVSVLMRYTLRLLTLQQYQRATGLICALEAERLQHMPDTEPISIGLWVGQASTPNRVREAGAALRMHRRPGAADTGEDASDPVQLRQCPWCGTPLDHTNYEILERRTMLVRCRRDDCAFRNALPVHIIDEDVYDNRPSLVIGTVDKFAMMPWKQDVGRLLGVGDRHFPPPDLIVQDELHLISGPLGTIVGLYETAIDAVIGKNAPAKLVASTATIRRATDQVRAVFARDARQFPPAGLTQRDSYFAVEAPREAKASREYLGVMAPGASQTTLMVRVYASLLQSASAVAEDDPSADLYWTLLGYFNSLRVLGGAYIQVLDDVPDQMKVIAGRRREAVRDAKAIREMTSRKRSSEIPRELQILERRRGESDAADVVLATNMISVGVDVDRLGLMVVMGQPQMSSEYIQATSRVGRRDPGLVVTVYNSGRSRDLSHYENFAAYHRSLYRHVEATGATPFAPRARDRALHAVLVSMARHRIADAGPSAAAANADQWESELRDQVDVIVQRAGSVRAHDETVPADEADERIRAELEELVEIWADAHVDHYEGWFNRSPGALLVEASRVLSQTADRIHFPPTDPPWPTLTSMRDVDAESNVFLVRRKGHKR